MTKSLTEKWKDGELIFGKTYWCSDDEGNVAKLVLVNKNRFYEWTLGAEVTKDVKEVLAPVPSYKQLTDMDEELKSLACKNDTLAMENGKLQEQLKEANEIILWHAITTGATSNTGLCRNYLSKWGVK